MRRFLVWLAFAALIAVGFVAVALTLLACGCGGGSLVTGARLATIRSDPTALRAFLGRMPKGGDLHVHLSGAVYAEDFIRWATEKELCYDASALSLAPCPPASSAPQAGAPASAEPSRTIVPLADALDVNKEGSSALHDRLVNSLSMRSFVPSPGVSGHDQFFGTFAKVGAITATAMKDMVAQALRLYAADSVQYTELMLTLMAADVQTAANMVKTLREEVEGILKCKSDKPESACGVTYRFIAQVRRNLSKEQVSARIAFAAELVRRTRDVVALNLVDPEDYRVARADYRDHMAMVRDRAKGIPVTLHAGELWLGLVPPQDLKFHIQEAVETAGAKRIGHGTSLAFEERMPRLLAEMSKRKVAVEINLTSNDMILGVRGREHPFMAYRAAGVPVVLSTDNLGVERIDLSNEYVRAARDYRLSYWELRAIARASLEHSFLPDEEKTKELERFERASAEFERGIVKELSLTTKVSALLRAPFVTR